MDEIQNYLVTLENFIALKPRALTGDDVALIQDTLLHVMQKIVRIANRYCKLMLVTDDLDMKPFRLRFTDYSEDERTIVEKFITRQNGKLKCDLEDISVKDDVDISKLSFDLRGFSQEFHSSMIQIYIRLLSEKEIKVPSEEKLSIVRQVWIQLYEAILSGRAIYSDDRAKDCVRKEIIADRYNTPFATLRHLFVHAGDHEDFNRNFQALLQNKQDEIIKLSIELLEIIAKDIHGSKFDEITHFLKDKLEPFCKLNIYKFTSCASHKVDLIRPFSLIGFNDDVIQTDSKSSIEYLLKRLIKFKDRIKSCNAQISAEDRSKLSSGIKPFLELSPKLQLNYLVLSDLVQEIGGCFNAILENSVFHPIHNAMDVENVQAIDGSKSSLSTASPVLKKGTSQRVKKPIQPLAPTKDEIAESKSRIDDLKRQLMPILVEMEACQSKGAQYMDPAQFYRLSAQIEDISNDISRERQKLNPLPRTPQAPLPIGPNKYDNIEDIDYRFSEIRALAIDCIDYRNSSIHVGIRSGTMEMTARLVCHCERIIELLESVVNDLEKDEQHSANLKYNYFRKI